MFNHLNVCDNLKNFFMSTVNELLNVMAEILSQIKEISKRISRQFIFQFNSFLHKTSQNKAVNWRLVKKLVLGKEVISAAVSISDEFPCKWNGSLSAYLDLNLRLENPKYKGTTVGFEDLCVA